MVVVLNSTLQVFLKTRPLKQHFSINKYLYGSNIKRKSISVRQCVVFYLRMLQQIPLYV